MTAKTKTVRRPASLRQASAPRDGAGLKTGIAIGLSAAMLLPAGAWAQDAVETLGTVKVEDTAIDPNPNAEVGVTYKARTSADERHTRPLAETPQSITVLTKSQIDDSGYTDLKNILDAQPGITVGTGENGNAFGDRYIIRGQDARSDVFVDGLRDPGMTVRESFAIEQLEVSKGPNSSFAGRGASGGTINAITKQATPDYDFGKINLAAGSDKHTRATVDINRSFGETFALRANALYGYEEVPGRGPAERYRRGAALSAHYIPNDKFDLTVDFYGFNGFDNPDTGGYLFNSQPVKDVPVYAQEEDFLRSAVSTVTGRMTYRFSDTMRLTNITRAARTDNGYVLTGARRATTSATGPGGTYVTGTMSSHQGWQDVTYGANQTNLYITTDLGGMKNDFVLGGEYTRHDVVNGIYRLTNTGPFNCATGTSTALNNHCIIGSDGKAANGVNSLLNRTITVGPWDQDWQVNNWSLYAMDTIDITDAITVFAGIRADKYDFDLVVQNTNTLALTTYDDSDTLLNGNIGVTFDVAPGVILYASATSSADINGGESDVGTSAGYGGFIEPPASDPGAQPKPERSVNFEVGAKFNVFDERLLLTAAAFQTTKSDVMEGAGYSAEGSYNTGKNRVKGIELSASGMLTDKLMVQGGINLMDAEILDSAANLDPANGNISRNIGKTLSNFADRQANLQIRYQLTDNFYFGGAVKYKSVRYGGQPDTAPAFNTTTGAYTQRVPAYTVFDAFAAYRINKDLELRVNVNNVGDKDYYLAVYQGGFFLYKGDGMASRATLTYEF